MFTGSGTTYSFVVKASTTTDSDCPDSGRHGRRNHHGYAYAHIERRECDAQPRSLNQHCCTRRDSYSNGDGTDQEWQPTDGYCGWLLEYSRDSTGQLPLRCRARRDALDNRLYGTRERRVRNMVREARYGVLQGSNFLYTQNFTVNDGDASKIASVQVTLTNSVGMSAAETAQ